MYEYVYVCTKHNMSYKKFDILLKSCIWYITEIRLNKKKKKKEVSGTIIFRQEIY